MADHICVTRTGQKERHTLFSVLAHAVSRPLYAALIGAVDSWLLQYTVDHPTTSIDMNVNRSLRGVVNTVTRFTEVGKANPL